MTADRRYFLDVRRSATGLAWEHRLSDRQEMVALAIAQSHGTGDLVARVLAGRGVTAEEAPRFLEPTIRDLLPDPATLTDMAKAAARIAEAVRRRERVAIFGDYDVDGAASSALLKRFLGHYGIDAEIYIPDRIFEGYGPNPAAMRELAARGAALIVTVDCGTNSAASVAVANESGADVVVLDHHQVGGPLPPAVAIVNPNREDDLSRQGHLCAAGVVFLTLVETVRVLRAVAPDRAPPDLLGWLDLVALATVCDVVPLAGVNRAFVVKGLLAIRRQENAGLGALVRVSRIGEPVNAFHLAFLIGPRINAGGRIGDAALGSRLLATDDPVEADRIAETLDRLNQERQAMEQVMLEAARAEVDVEIAGGGPAILVTGSERWHPGIVGLLASRLKEHARRPVFAIAFNASGVGTGSGRSVTGFDLGRLVRDALAEGLIVKGGGHAMAAGITVERSRLGDLRAFFEARAATEVSRLRDAESLKIDAALSAEGATQDLLDLLEKAGPYGAGHPQPVFVLPRHRIVDVREVGTGHLRVDLKSEAGGTLRAMAFRSVGTPLGEFLTVNRGRTVHVAGNISGNYWNGARNVQFRVLDAALA
ncbi:MAG TPA: single-stranded-DNA-specific exonuclease RecJ [Rhizobiales bacterium]|nr:single-stranded-DNA-specific exonuclease RecJ [Hyphomicrobiales bacterium]